jgi:hypothetical protein
MSRRVSHGDHSAVGISQDRDMVKRRRIGLKMLGGAGAALIVENDQTVRRHAPP